VKLKNLQPSLHRNYRLEQIGKTKDEITDWKGKSFATKPVFGKFRERARELEVGVSGGN
jgi:hypothetical protein